MILYTIRSFMLGPFFFIVLPIFYFKYHTLRYRFDGEGIHMRWGILFRQEINLTYTRIQDIHLTSGIIQRWLGLADIKIQTASGNAGAEMTLEGLPEFEMIRDYLYSKMRGVKDKKQAAGIIQRSSSPSSISNQSDEMTEILAEIRNELRSTRQALEKIDSTKEED